MEKSYEELQKELADLMEKIDESMTMTRKQQKDLDKMEKAMMNEAKPMKLESKKAEFEIKGQYKTEFDEMTKNALVNAQKNIYVLRDETEKAYQDMLMETVRKQKRIQEKLASMKAKDLTPEKLELVEESARKALENANKDMFEFQKKHFEQRATLNNYEDSIKKYALELGVENELNAVNPKQAIEEFKNANKEVEMPEETPKAEETSKVEINPEPEKESTTAGTETVNPTMEGTTVGTETVNPTMEGTTVGAETANPTMGGTTVGAETANPTMGETTTTSEEKKIEEIILENNAEEFSRNCTLEEFKKEIFEDVDFVRAIFETDEATQEEKDDVIEAMYEHPKMDRRLLYKLTHDENANPKQLKAYLDMVSSNGKIKRFSEKEVEELKSQLPTVSYDLKRRNGVKFAERYDNYQDALKTQELFEKMGCEEKIEVNIGWFDKTLFGLKAKWDKFMEKRNNNLLLSDGEGKEQEEPEATSSLRDDIKVKTEPEATKAEPAPVEEKEPENDER